MIYPRNFYTDKIYFALQSLPIVILIGARQVGKTTILENLVLSGAKVTLSGQDPETAEIFQKFSNLESYLGINLNNNIEGYLLIDEFQFIPGISTMLKLLVDKYKNLKILCTGSSSPDILQKVEESLAGRVRVIEVFPLSFEEYLMFTNKKLYNLFKKYNLNTRDEVVDKQLTIVLGQYLLYGGLPRVVLAGSIAEKMELLDDIYRTYLLRDVRSYIKNEDTVGFNKLLKLLAAQIGSLVNINELSNSTGLSYKKSEEYLSLLEQMYIIKLLEPFLTNKRKVVSKMRKVYFSDTGLRNLIYGSFNDMNIRTDAGNIFENYVFTELKLKLGKTGMLNFYRTQDGTEVDFIANNLYETITLEVKNKDIKNPIFMRNLASLNEISNISRSYLINRTLNTQHYGIHFIQGYFVPKII